MRVPLRRTWVSLVAGGLAEGRCRPLAEPGAVLADVRSRQLPRALAAAPHLATLLIGLNDVIRAGFDAARVRADLARVVGELRAGGAVVLVARLHDPTLLLPLPVSLRRAVRDRVTVVNCAVDAAGLADPGVHVLDLAAVPALRGRPAWAVDRLHPSNLGHQAVAAAALDLLDSAGFAVTARSALVPETAPARRWQEAGWLVRHGLPWFVGHGRQVALPAARMALCRAGLGASGSM